MAESGYRARLPGTLPATSRVILGGARLPPGRLVAPDPEFTRAGPAGPVLWVTEQPVHHPGTIWKKIAAGFSSHGLWPLVLPSVGGGDDPRPWLAGELDPALSTSPDAHDAEQVLARWWRQATDPRALEDEDDSPEEADDADAAALDAERTELIQALAPFERDFPGLASAASATGDQDAPASVAAGANGRLGLVAVARPADALAWLGWTGPANHFADMGMLGAVLRSWEDRFGAYLIGVGFDTLLLGVERPARDARSALAIAAEHFAVCPDIVFQGAGTLGDYAAMLVDEPGWALWWD